MTHAATRRILLSLMARHGAFPVVVFDVDEFALFTSHAGPQVGASALAQLGEQFERRGAHCNGHVHHIDRDRFLVALPGDGYDQAVAFAEQCVDAVRDLAIPFSGKVSVVDLARPPRLSVTAAVVSVQSRTDVERFELRVDDLLRDGKSTGGDAIVRDR